MTCDGVTSCLSPGNCPTMTHLHVEASTCGFSNLMLRATSLSSQACTWAIEAPDGGTWGTISFYGYDSVSANLPSLGGPCVGSQLPTGAIRFSVGCSDCMLSVRPEVVGP